jgi:Fur family peroxide stress response transcriptional regulator
MPDPEIRYEELITALRERQFRLTPQRMELVRLIAASEGHPSAARLYEKVTRKFPTMSLATVYKTLLMLKEIGQVLEVRLQDDSHYDGNRIRSHPHLVCTRCGRITDGKLQLDRAVLRKAAGSSGFRISSTQIILYGLCSSCRRKVH